MALLILCSSPYGHRWNFVANLEALNEMLLSYAKFPDVKQRHHQHSNHPARQLKHNVTICHIDSASQISAIYEQMKH